MKNGIIEALLPDGRHQRVSFAPVILFVIVTLLSIGDSSAGSATWSANPASSDWNTAANWTPNTVPNGAADTATFGISNTTDISTSANVEVNGITYSGGANAYSVTLGLGFAFTVSGAGITNSSGVMQNFVTAADGSGLLLFTNNAIVGSQIAVTNPRGSLVGGVTLFNGNSSAGNGTFTNVPGQDGFQSKGTVFFVDSATAGQATFLNPTDGSGVYGGVVQFADSSNGGSATFVSDGNGGVEFVDDSSANSGVFTNNDIASAGFFNNSSAGHGTFVNNPSLTGPAGAFVTFNDHTTAESSLITNNGSISNRQGYGRTTFDSFSGGGDATIINNGSAIAGGTGGFTIFSGSASAGNATLIANDGGANAGGSVKFIGNSVGGTARIEVFGNGALHIDAHSPQEVPIGSLEGDGPVTLGTRLLIVGSNSLDTTYTGVIQGSGSVRKNGNGTLTLTGANAYSLGTYVDSGSVVVANTDGSGLGTGLVQVNAGTLGGSGIISGPVTIGTGNGAGAFLAPAHGTKTQATLTIQSALTFNADATYTYTFKAKKKKAKTDKVIANGVTINGAAFSFQGTPQGTLKQGLVLTAISNTATTPIAGTFSNLADGAILTVNGNKFQASYEGGDGNDLTLTVVP
jgi:autotransporter-associated beta strand protein